VILICFFTVYLFCIDVIADTIFVSTEETVVTDVFELFVAILSVITHYYL
jgi:hypothetical protein